MTWFIIFCIFYLSGCIQEVRSIYRWSSGNWNRSLSDKIIEGVYAISAIMLIFASEYSLIAVLIIIMALIRTVIIYPHFGVSETKKNWIYYKINGVDAIISLVLLNAFAICKFYLGIL